VFPGEVYGPRGSSGASGTIVVEYVHGRDRRPWDEPARLTVHEDSVVAIDGGGTRGEDLRADVAAREKTHGARARVIDSWHGGMNPRAPAFDAAQPDLLASITSPGLMHFHLGRVNNPLSLGVLHHTLEVDGEKVFERGKLLAAGAIAGDAYTGQEARQA
jgi:hypothetical protein